MICIILSRKLTVKIGEAYFIIYTWFMESKLSEYENNNWWDIFLPIIKQSFLALDDTKNPPTF